MRPSARLYQRESIPDSLVESAKVTGKYLGLLLGASFYLWLLSLFWKDKILLTFHDLQGSGFSTEGLSRVWFIFAWGFAVTLIVGLIIRFAGDSFSTTSRTVEVLKGWWLSINAGVFEELIFRWILFFTAMIVLPFINFITFGFCKWWYGHVMIPLANFTTFHALDAQLHDPRSWVMGAAIISASISFRDGHKHLGRFGMVNAWFGGMVFFWLMFNYGILTAIVAHIVYDAIVFTIEALIPERL